MSTHTCHPHRRQDLRARRAVDISKDTLRVTWKVISDPALVGRRGMAKAAASSADQVHRRDQGRAVMDPHASAVAVAIVAPAELVTTTKIVPVVRRMATS